MRVAIAGGGIGGLTAALCLQQAGIEPVVIERAPQLGDVGAGLQLSPNAMQVLGTLGLEPALRRQAVEPEALEMRHGASGTLVFAIPAGAAMQRRFGAPYLHIHRADLVACLAQALAERAPQALRLGVAVTAAVNAGGGVDVALSDGSSLRVDALVGADGIHSTVRALLGLDDTPRFTGQVAWRATVEASRLPPGLIARRATVWTGPGRHVVTYQLRGGQLVNLVAVIEQDGWTGESWTEPGNTAELAAAFAGFCTPVRTALAAVDSCYRWALHDRAPQPVWSYGRIGLMGDAVHPMLPFQAQGAAMAIEDAFVLARCLQAFGPEEGWPAYAGRRQARTAQVQAAARANAGIFHRTSPLAQLATYGPMWAAARLLPGFVNSRQDWIYACNVTDAPL